MPARVVARDGGIGNRGSYKVRSESRRCFAALNPTRRWSKGDSNRWPPVKNGGRIFNYSDQPEGLLLTQNQAIFSRATVESCSSSGEAVANLAFGGAFHRRAASDGGYDFQLRSVT